MKFVAVIEYGSDREAKKAHFPEHRLYLRGMLESGQLWAAGLQADNKGAIWVFEAETLADADSIVRGDPLHRAGVFVDWQLHTLAYWSAKEAKGT